MNHRTMWMCAGLVIAGLTTAGCNEVLGLGGDFTLTDASGGAGSTSGSSTSSVTSTSTADGSGSGTSTGTAMGVEATCEEYCATIGANCTGANLEYQTGICPEMCALMKKGHVGDTSGDTVGCRLTKAKLAASEPVTYCQQAGALGVDGCAEPCDAFCNLALATCFEDEVFPFADIVECTQECQLLDYVRLADGGNDVSTTWQQNLNCWLYHLQVSNVPTNPNAAKGHCPHFGGGPGDQCH